jgi:uncharacterized alkaline shock family protein YloU
VSSIVGRILEEETSAESTPGGTRLPGDASPTVGEFFGGLAGSQRGARGVSVEVGEGEVAVDLTVALPYGSSVPEITNRMRRSVIRGIEEMTGLRVTQVDITVNAMFPPGGNR